MSMNMGIRRLSMNANDIDIEILTSYSYFRRLRFFFALHLSNPSLVAAKTPRLKKKPPMSMNKIEPV